MSDIQHDTSQENENQLDFIGTEIAVIGMACRFPGADSPEEFWHNIKNGVESIRAYSDEELLASGVPESHLNHPNYVKAGGPLDKMEMFDPRFFGLGPKEAAVMDPQHRHFLECAWEALEHSGYDPSRVEGSIGVFGGSGHNLYLPYNVLTNQHLLESEGFFLLRHTGNDKDFLTTRVSYAFNLKGPSVNVQTACSTSLVAIHYASQSLLNAECDMALAGGVTIEIPHRQGYFFEEGEILAPDGRCRAFDASSEGTIFGSGVGVVMLKRLSDALQDGDTIHAIILGSAVNNDGAEKASYLAPSPEGQALAISEALNLADIGADTITYVETHGTGTRIGDPIEIQGLTQAFRQSTTKTGYCAIGSTKPNIGHLDTAAGVAGFIKTVMALKHRQLPPSINYEQPNPMIDFPSSPFFVNTELKDWRTENDIPRRAGVSSLGVGGTNAHILLQEPPPQGLNTTADPQMFVVPISAVNAPSLDGNTENLANYLTANPNANLADIIFTLQHGRKAFAQRRVVVGRNREELLEALTANDLTRTVTRTAADNTPEMVFAFPGGGAQYPNMGIDLYHKEPEYRKILDEGFAILKSKLAIDLKPLMFPAAGEEEDAALELQRPSLSLPSIFLTEYALARLWQQMGIEPQAMIGHSMGEYTAACLAGVFSLEDALSIVTLRGQLFETLPEGGMISVPLPESQLIDMLPEGLSIAVINNPEISVVSGEVKPLEAFTAILESKDIPATRIKINVAAHSPMLDPILDTFKSRLQQVTMNPPMMPYISNVTGTWIKPEEATDPDYWVTHLRHTVRFADGLETLFQNPNRVILEVGPGRALTSLARQHPSKLHQTTAITSMRHVREIVPDDRYFYLTFGALWTAGIDVDWSIINPVEGRRRIPLPTYAFDHQAFWIDPGNTLFVQSAQKDAHLAKQKQFNDWFYQPVWKHAPLPRKLSAVEPKTWLIFEDDSGIGHAVRDILIERDYRVVTVGASDRFQQIGEREFLIRPSMRSDYIDLFEFLQTNELVPDQITHFWTYNNHRLFSAGANGVKFALDRGLYSLMYLAQAIGESGLSEQIHVNIVTSGAKAIGDRERILDPEKALLYGPAKVIPREYPNITCKTIDLPAPPASQRRLFRANREENPQQLNRLINRLLPELLTQSENSTVAYRDSGRWLETFEAVPPDVLPARDIKLRKNGTYLITGGMGGIGYTLAEYLAETYQAKLVLINRTPLPNRDEWTEWLETKSPKHPTSRKIRQLLTLEKRGGQVTAIAADVADERQISAAVRQAVSQFGPLHGVIHAAGVVHDNLIQLKATDEVEKVIAPKVTGTVNLYKVIEKERLSPDFMVLFSSTSTVIAPPGQIDYVAANTFLNHFAAAHSLPQGKPIIALNWGVWQEVGMAAGILSGDQELPAGMPTEYPLLQVMTTDEENKRSFVSDLSVNGSWWLDQHRIKQGRALIPGTGYLELARASLTNSSTFKPVVIKDIFFLSPLSVPDQESRRMSVTLEKEYQEFSFSVVSGVDSQEIDHARGRVQMLNTPPPAARLSIQDVLDRCRLRQVEYAAGEQETRQETFLDFGPRWKNLREVYYGDHEAIGRLQLPKQYHDDLQTFFLHPALLDLATSIGLPLTAGYEERDDFYVPLSYGSVKIYRPLTGEIWSHATLRQSAISNEDIPVFDITIVDEKGRILVEIEQFIVKRIDHKEILALQEDGTPAAAATKEETFLEKTLPAGITPAEGVKAFLTVLETQTTPQTIISSIALPSLIDFVNQKSAQSGDGSQVSLSRPNLSSEFIEPETEIEKLLARFWEDLLGVAPIGTQDDFFELGGHSLIAVRLFTKIKKSLHVDFSLATLFEAPTIAQFAALIAQTVSIPTDNAPSTNGSIHISQNGQWSPVVQISAGEESIPPFFCIHGAGGNVLNFQSLMQHIGQDIPFFGLQARGVDGKHPPHKTLEEMAASYLEGIKQVRPHGPYILGGYSGGGVVALEIAKRLRELGDEVPLIIFLDTFHPWVAPRRRGLREHISNLTEEGISYLWRGFSRRISERFSEREKELVIQDLNLKSETIPVDLREWMLVENFTTALKNYEPELYTGRVIQFSADITWEQYSHVEQDRGWGDLTPNMEVIIVPGDHDSVVIEPNVQILASYIRSLFIQEIRQPA